MAKKTLDGKFKCSICNAVYAQNIEAVTCETQHDIIYVPFYREDLFKLVNFLYTKDSSLLSPRLVDTIMKYRNKMKGVAKND